MAQALALQSRRIVTPTVAFIVALVAVAALALGFGLRTWTEKSSPAPQVVVLSGAGSSQQPHCKMGRPC